MRGQRPSLADFVLRVCNNVGPLPDPLEQGPDLRARAAVAGQFLLLARRHSDENSLPPRIREALSDVTGEPSWEAFLEACELAERIDAFLATLEQGGPGGQVARECRDDLDLLPVLADWCDDNGLPLSAAEARHLHRLIDARDREYPLGQPAAGEILDWDDRSGESGEDEDSDEYE
jgi:hypothetical protein